MNSLVPLSGLSGFLLQQTKKEEQFANVAAITGSVFVAVVIIMMLLSILFLVTIYNMVPSHKLLHTVLSLLFGFFYFIPMLTYLVLGSGYTLKKDKK
jgi:hypothetical protein